MQKNLPKLPALATRLASYLHEHWRALLTPSVASVSPARSAARRYLYRLMSGALSATQAATMISVMCACVLSISTDVSWRRHVCQIRKLRLSFKVQNILFL